MGEFLNLNEVGALTNSGKQYEGNAESNLSSAKNHQAKMEGLQSGYKGSSGSTFQNVAAASTNNHGFLAKQIAEQARRAVLTEKAALVGDEDATTTLNPVKSSVESFTSAVSKPINV